VADVEATSKPFRVVLVISSHRSSRFLKL